MQTEYVGSGEVRLTFRIRHWRAGELAIWWVDKRLVKVSLCHCQMMLKSRKYCTWPIREFMKISESYVQLVNQADAALEKGAG